MHAHPIARRLHAATLLVALLVGMFGPPGTASARVVFGPSAQQAFGLNEHGSKNAGEREGEFPEAWDKFTQSAEGNRIEDMLDDLDVEITIEVLPADQVGGGEAWGTTAVSERDPETGEITKMVVKLRATNTGGVNNLATTLHHELRHVEEWLGDDREEVHDTLDAEVDPLNLKFQEDLKGIDEAAAAAAERERRWNEYLIDRAREADEAAQLANDFRTIAEILFEDSPYEREDPAEDLIDSIEVNVPNFSFDGKVIDLTEATGFTVEFTIEEVDELFNESVFECGASEPQLVICPQGVQPMPAGEVLVLWMTLAGEVPRADASHSYIYSATFDSDGDAANDWQFHPPFNWDFFRGTDRWYQLAWSHTQAAWTLTVTQVDANQSQAPVRSSVRAVIDADTVIFFIPAGEFARPLPGYRLTAFGHDGRFSEGARAGDVTGADPTEQLRAPLQP